MQVERGARCLARLGPSWVDAVVQCVHPSGTVSIVEAGKEGGFMSDWHGFGASELSVDDEARWARLAAAHAGEDGALGPPELAGLLAAGGVGADEARTTTWWQRSEAALFETAAARRPPAEVYRMLRAAGLCAKALDPSEPENPWIPLWWNQVRMGGRDPAEVPDPIGVAEAEAALGLGADDDPATVAAIDAFEAAHGLRVPAELRTLASRKGFAGAFLNAHCNNPEWLRPDAWEVVRDLRAAGLVADVGLVVVQPHQGDHVWMVVFEPGDATATVYARHPTAEGPVYLQTAPTLAFFVWDLARTGEDWARAIAADPLPPR